MKLSTLLLSSAALLVAGAAYAADLPAKKAAPAAAPTGCAAFGAGYIAIPGGDTCLKISGYVRSNNTYVSNVKRPTTSPYSLGFGYGLQFDAKNQTEVGTVGSQIFFEPVSGNPATTNAFVSLGGFTAGKATNLFDFGFGYNYTGSAFGAHVGQLQYAAAFGATTVSVAATQSQDFNNGATVTTNAASRPDLQALVSTSVGQLKLNVGGVSHEVVAANGSAQGYAFIGNAVFDAGVATLSGYAAYSNGALAYTGIGSGNSGPGVSNAGFADSAADASAISTGSLYQAQIDVPVGKNDSIGLFGESINAKQGDLSASQTQVAVALKHTIAKGLWIRPEIYQQVLTVPGSDKVTTNAAYIRIQRDF